MQVEKRQLFAVVEGHDLAVENELVGKPPRPLRNLVELPGDAAEVAREKFRPLRAAMELRPNAVKLVLHVNHRLVRRLAGEAHPDRLRRWLRASQHAFDRAKKCQLREVEFAPGGKQRSLADVAEQHVSLFQFIERGFESARDRFFDQTFAQPDTQVAGQDFDHILRFEGREFLQPGLEQFRFRDRPAGFVQGFEKSERFA